jgi:hypothetical protein
MRAIGLFAAILAFSAFSPVYAACSAASIKGNFAVGGFGEFYDSRVGTFGIGLIIFDGVNRITVVTDREGYGGAVGSYTGTGTYVVDYLCRGSAAVTLRHNGVVVGYESLVFVASGTAASPEITALISNAAARSSGVAHFKKIGL